MARKLAIWFHRTFGDPAFKPSPFLPPPDPTDAAQPLREELAATREELALAQARARKATLTAAEEARLREAAEAEAKAAYADMEAALELSHETEAAVAEQQRLFEAGLAERQAEAAKATPEALSATVEAAQTAAADLDLSEAETRRMIDLQLVEAGWEADSDKLRHSRGTRPIKGRNLAIATSSANIALIKYLGKHGRQLPRNPSLSMTLTAARTTTSVRVEAGAGRARLSPRDSPDHRDRQQHAPRLGHRLERVRTERPRPLPLQPRPRAGRLADGLLHPRLAPRASRLRQRFALRLPRLQPLGRVARGRGELGPPRRPARPGRRQPVSARGQHPHRQPRAEGDLELAGPRPDGRTPAGALPLPERP